jgi:hypothetical protein
LFAAAQTKPAGTTEYQPPGHSPVPTGCGLTSTTAPARKYPSTRASGLGRSYTGVCSARAPIPELGRGRAVGIPGTQLAGGDTDAAGNAEAAEPDDNGALA